MTIIFCHPVCLHARTIKNGGLSINIFQVQYDRSVIFQVMKRLGRSHRFKESTRSIRIKHLITGYGGNQIFRVEKIDDVMSPARNHIKCFDLILADLKFYSFPCVILNVAKI